MDITIFINSVKNKKILQEAFTHRSYLNESREQEVESNERLEFLGDAVLEIVVSEHLFDQFPEHPEGKLTLLRASIVRTETLASAAKQLGLGKLLRLSRGEEEHGGRENMSILANTYESFVGALYRDGGFDKARDFIQKTLFPYISDIVANKSYRDAKSSLQEKVQEQLKVTPTYQVLTEEGPDHEKLFTIGVFVNDKQIGQGKGRSKQEAEAEAATEALNQFS